MSIVSAGEYFMVHGQLIWRQHMCQSAGRTDASAGVCVMMVGRGKRQPEQEHIDTRPSKVMMPGIRQLGERNH